MVTLADSRDGTCRPGCLPCVTLIEGAAGVAGVAGTPAVVHNPDHGLMAVTGDLGVRVLLSTPSSGGRARCCGTAPKHGAALKPTVVGVYRRQHGRFRLGGSFW